jgi:hypothetical protein
MDVDQIQISRGVISHGLTINFSFKILKLSTDYQAKHYILS